MSVLERWMRRALVVGGVGLVVGLLGAVFDVDAFLRAYLWAWLFWLSAALGGMSVVMLHHMTGGRWGWPVRRAGEAAGMTMPALAVMFVPIAVGARHLFPWAVSEEVARDAILQHRRVVFGVGFTLARSFVYLVIWSLWAWRLRALSLEHDRTGDLGLLRSLRRMSAVGFVVYFVTMSLAAMDWVASREVNWYSSTFGLVTCLGQAVVGVACLIVAVAGVARVGLLGRDVLRERAVHDLGNLLLTVVVLWAYTSFAQYLVIWMGDTQEDNGWFIHRLRGGWWFVGVGVIVFHFAVPFVVLLFQRVKKEIGVLAWVAGGVLVMRAVDVVWMVNPSSRTEVAGGVSWMDLVMPVGIGGIWVACFLWVLSRRQLVPEMYRTEAAEAEAYDAGTRRSVA